MDPPTPTHSTNPTTTLELPQQSHSSSETRDNSQTSPIKFRQLLCDYRRAQGYTSSNDLPNWWEVANDGDEDKVTSPWWEVDDDEGNDKITSSCSFFGEDQDEDGRRLDGQPDDSPSDYDSVPDDDFSDATFTDDSDEEGYSLRPSSSSLYLPGLGWRMYRSGWWEEVGSYRSNTSRVYSRYLEQDRLPSIAEE